MDNLRPIKRSNSMNENDETPERKKFISNEPHENAPAQNSNAALPGMLVNIKKEEELIISPDIDVMQNMESNSPHYNIASDPNDNNLGESSNNFRIQNVSELYKWYGILITK